MIAAFARGFRSIERTTRTSTTSSTLLLAKKSKTTKAKREGEFWEARMDGWRPTVNDVERISWGKPAKKKGTGSRGIPHRLNDDERFLFDQARRKGFLEVAGSGWRSQRREAPLLNSYRSLCDARGQANVVLHKSNTGVDELVVDLSPLRNPENFDEIARVCLDQSAGGETIFQVGEAEESEEEEKEERSLDEATAWETRPIYQLPAYCIAWELSRPEAKALGKRMAEMFDTAEGKVAPSRKPVGVKPGKSRRHGGYGIG
jgi:hypothetical protein